MIEDFKKALEAANLKIIKFDPSKARQVSTSRKGTVTVEKFSKIFIEELRQEVSKFPNLLNVIYDVSALEDLLIEHAKENGRYKAPVEMPKMPKELEGTTLNCDMSATGRESGFFVTDKDEYVSPISGEFYIRFHQLKIQDAAALARNVFPKYLPRSKPGVFLRKDESGNTATVYNKYVPPRWIQLEKKEVVNLPDKLPKLFEKLVVHLFPLEIEREFFYYWLYCSLYERAYTYLILCGAPGTGKNRLKLVMRALHGHTNSIDGKVSTLKERFNSQLADSTLAWFDELYYDSEMENYMKEVQNDSISIERKGVDATRSTQIFASLVISNNKPRDNYITFDARKFVPLVINTKRLETSMSFDEIDELTKKVEKVNSKHFDANFLLQIARWIKKHGAKKKWPNQEYRGPMFYKLAHTSMTKWQKRAASTLLTISPDHSSRLTYDDKHGYLWSTLLEYILKKNPERGLNFPDNTSVKYFFNIFLNGKGKKAFETKDVVDDIMGDFWVKCIDKKSTIIKENDMLDGKPSIAGGQDAERKAETNKKKNRPYIDL